MRTHHALGLITVITTAGAGACDTNISGRLGATATGDLSNPAAERRDGRLAITDACGQSQVSPSASATPFSFVRTPYLQQVTSDSADLSWVATADAGQSVVVSAVDGTVVGNSTAAPDTSAAVASGASQWLAPLRPLAPDTIYCYDVQTPGAVSDRLGFHTAPPAGSGAPVRFLAFGDSGGGGSDQMALRDQMA